MGDVRIKKHIEKNGILFLIKLIKVESPSFFLLMLVQIIYKGSMPLIGTYISAYLIEQVLASFSGNANVILPLCLQCGYFLLNSLYDTIYSLFYKICSEKFTNGIRNKIMEKSKDIDLSFFDSPESYGKLENAKREVGTRPLIVINSFCELISRFISMFGFMVILVSFIYSIGIKVFFIFIIFLGVAIYSALVNLKFKNKSYQYMKNSSKQRRQMNYYSELVLNKEDVKEVKIYNLTDIFIDKYNKVFQNYFLGMKKLFIKEGRINITASIGMGLLRCILFYFIVVNVDSIEKFTIYTNALSSISSSIVILIFHIAGIYEGMLFLDNLRDFLNEVSHINISKNLRKPNKNRKHTIEFKGVSFIYPGSDTYVLKNINLQLETGKFIVFIGLNGAGKSTLMKLLVRLYDPTEGTIFLDGYDIRDYEVKALYKLFGVLFQDYSKYVSTVNENILFGRGKVAGDLQEIIKASEKANAKTFIQKTKNTYSTPLTRFLEEEGVELSIGQWQKLALSRVFYSDAQILVLDEPTASLDTETEQKFYRVIEEENKNKLVVLITHKLTGIDKADSYVLLKDGQILEKGNHDELMSHRGKYYQLYTTQNNRCRRTT